MLNYQDPLRIYVLWHPDSTLGKDFAEGIYQWFRGNPAESTETGCGIPVFYRSSAQASGEPPRPIDSSQAKYHILVPLVDEHMVTDIVWRRYLSQPFQAESEIPHAVCPVALHKTAYQLPGEFNRLNFLRIDRYNDPDYWSHEKRMVVQQQRLLLLLTEFCSRLLWYEQQHDEFISDAQNLAPLPVKIFLSHAKADGTGIAEALRIAIFERGQAQVFFDETDLAIGYGFSQELKNCAGVTATKTTISTTAMIAILTDQYASRPWCLRELRLARTPVLVEKNAQMTSCWRVKPLLVVDALAKSSLRLLPEVGYAPVVRWDKDHIDDIYACLMREILFMLYQEIHAKNIPRQRHMYAINCQPDAQMLLALLQQTNRSQKIQTLLVPPPGPAYIDRQALQQLLQYAYGKKAKVAMKTFEEIEMEKNT